HDGGRRALFRSAWEPRTRNDRSLRRSWTRRYSGGDAEQGDWSDWRVRVRFEGLDRVLVSPGTAVSIFDVASAVSDGNLPGRVRAARFRGRRKADQETLGQHQAFQAQAKETRIQNRRERNAHHADFGRRCGKGVRIFARAIFGRRAGNGDWVSNRARR